MSYLKTKKVENRAPILEYFWRNLHRPVLLGQIALLCRYSISQAEVDITALMDEGFVREATPTECQSHGISHGLVLVAGQENRARLACQPET